MLTLTKTSLLSLALSLVFLPTSASAFLLALSPGEQATPLWERVLLTFDPLSESQTVVAQVALKGAPQHLAVLTAVPRGVELSYTTTSIWRELSRHVGAQVIYEQTLELAPYSLLWRALHSKERVTPRDADRRGVWRSQHTGVYATESALHEWLITQGLTLSPANASALKEVYAQGLAVAALLIRPKRPHDHAHEETWSSTWIFTSPTTAPHYWATRPKQPHPLPLTHTELEQPYTLTLTTLTEWPTKLPKVGDRRRERWGELRQDKRALNALLVREESLLSPNVTAYTEVDREQVASFNDRLRSTRWNFRRGGTLTQFEATPREGVWRVDVERAYTPPDVARRQERRARKHTLPLPLEPLALMLYALWWLWFRYAAAED